MSKRLNLREFQQNLIDRMQTKGSSDELVSTMGVQIAGRNWLVEMADVAEVLPLPRLTVVPFAKPWFRGMANVRGNLFGVVDIAAYGQSGAIAQDDSNRILLVAGRYAFNVALLVDRVLGLRDARAWRQTEGAGGQIEYQDEQGTSWRKLDVSDLLKQAEFLQIGS
ncbi:MAG: chemotaxis protein CheW [Nitrosomonadales bacterium]|nr:chemotaxis protein CheW [Nitrosomonadales bacterium]